MHNRLIIIGAGGHGKVIADIAIKNGYTDIRFVDDSATGKCMGFPIEGTSSDIESFDDGYTDFVIAIGNNKIRKKFAEKYNVNWVSIIHKSAQIATDAAIGKGTVVMACAVVNASAQVGKHCIINTGAVIEHDNIIEDYVHISPKVALGGTVKVGEQTHVGIGAVVSNDIRICEECVIGAGAVVVKNIEKAGTYIGIPVRSIK